MFLQIIQGNGASLFGHNCLKHMFKLGWCLNAKPTDDLQELLQKQAVIS